MKYVLNLLLPRGCLVSRSLSLSLFPAENLGAKEGRMNEMGEMSAPLIFLLPTIPYTSSLVTRLSLTFCALLWEKNKAPEEEAGPEAVNIKFTETFLVQRFELKA